MQLRVCAVKIVDIARTTSRNAWAANIAGFYIVMSEFNHKSELKFKNPFNQSYSLGTFCMPI